MYVQYIVSDWLNIDWSSVVSESLTSKSLPDHLELAALIKQSRPSLVVLS